MDMKKFISRKFGAAGGAIAIIATLPIDPLAKGIIIGAVAIGYVVSQALVDAKTGKASDDGGE